MASLIEFLRPLFGEAFSLWGAPATWLELLAFALAVAMVWCNIRTLPWGWPLAALSSALYLVLFWDAKLFGEAALQVFFIAMAMWGWWQWLRGSDEQGHALTVRELGASQWTWVLLALAILWPALGLFLRHFTHSDVPWWDAFTTSSSVVATWLLGRKFLENWPAWVLVNAVSVALFAHKGLWLTTLLYAVFILMALQGWRQWRAMLSSPVSRAAVSPVSP
jgi:nicotinamide mononucleotide transporter